MSPIDGLRTGYKASKEIAFYFNKFRDDGLAAIKERRGVWSKIEFTTASATAELTLLKRTTKPGVLTESVIPMEILKMGKIDYQNKGIE